MSIVRACASHPKNAYDLYLSRTLKHAQLVHAPSSPGAIELFVSEKLDAAAGVKQQLLAFAKTHRMCTGRFMAIEQTMGTPKAGMWEPVIFVRSSRRSRRPGSSGLVAEALERSGQADTTVALRHQSNNLGRFRLAFGLGHASEQLGFVFDRVRHGQAFKTEAIEAYL